MKRSDRVAATVESEAEPTLKSNGRGDNRADVSHVNLSVILSSLQTMRDGDFSVRLPGNWTNLEGKIADTFNEIVTANQKMAKELKRVGKVVGKEGRTRERMRFDLRSTNLEGKIADTFNEIVTANQKMAKELKRVGKVVGKEGRTRERMRFDL